MPTVKPDPLVRLVELQYDDENGFAVPVRSYIRNHAAGTFTFGGQTLPVAERENLAEAIDGIFAADFVSGVDPNGYLINGGAFAVAPVLNAAGDTLQSIQVGAQVYTLGAASSLVAALNADLAL